MTAAHLVLSRLRRWWQGVTRPQVTLAGEQQRQARLLGQVLLLLMAALLLYGLFLMLFPDPTLPTLPWWQTPNGYYGFVALLILLVAYGLNRSGHQLGSAGVLVVLLSGLIFLATILTLLGRNPRYPPTDATLLVYLIIPAILAVMLLPTPVAVSLMGLNLLFALVLPFFFPQLAWADFLLGVFLLLMATSFSLLLLHFYRQRLTAMQWRTLVESEQRYRTLFEGVPVGLYRMLPTGQVVDANPAFLQLVGLSLAELRALPTGPWPLLGTAAFQRWQALQETRQVDGHEVVWERPDGTVLWVRENVHAVTDAAGQVIAYEGAVEDITARHQAEQAVQRWLERQQAIEQLVIALSQYTDLPGIYRQLYAHVRTWMDVDEFYVTLYDRAQQQLRAVFAVIEGRELDPETLPPLPLAPPGRGKQSRVLRTGQPLYIPDARATWHEHDHLYVLTPEGRMEPYTERGAENGLLKIQSLLYVPMKVYGEPIGVLGVESHRLAAYTPADVELLTSLAAVTAVAMQNARLMAELQRSNASLSQQIAEQRLAEAEIRRRVAQQEALNTVIAAAVAASDLDQLVTTTLQATLQALDLELGLAWLEDRVTCQGAPDWWTPEVITLIRQTGPVTLLHSLGVEDWEQVTAEPWNALAPALRAQGLRATLTVPVWVAGQRRGSLSLLSQRPHSWTAEQIALAETMGRQLGSAAERLQLLARLQEQASQLAQIVETVPAGMALLDARLSVQLANATAWECLSVLGLTTGVEGLPQPNPSPLAQLLTGAGIPMPRDVVVAGPPRRIFEVMARPVAGDQTAAGWVLWLREVTREREIQERMQRQEQLAVVGQITAGIAHDFNNLLSVIVLYTQMVARRPYLAAQDRERLQIVMEQADQAAHLIQQILDFSRRSVIEPAPLDLLPMLKELVKMLQRTLPENIRLELTYRATAYWVHGDPTRLQQVVMNLVVNARDAMPQGGKLRLTLDQLHVDEDTLPPLPELTPGEWVVLAVSDTGVGIPPEVQPHIFEPFFTTKAPGHGSGLGLAQVYSIVTRHGGQVGLKSVVGEGTTFEIYLPALPPWQEWQTPVASREVPLGQGQSILIVEDDAVMRAALVSALQALNYQVLVASNGLQGVELFRQRRDEIALVLSDWVMPELNGLEMARLIQRLAPTVKILLMTGYPHQEEVEQLALPAVVGWLSKPVSVVELAQAIHQALATSGGQGGPEHPGRDHAEQTTS